MPTCVPSTSAPIDGHHLCANANANKTANTINTINTIICKSHPAKARRTTQERRKHWNVKDILTPSHPRQDGSSLAGSMLSRISIVRTFVAGGPCRQWHPWTVLLLCYPPRHPAAMSAHFTLDGNEKSRESVCASRVETSYKIPPATYHTDSVHCASHRTAIVSNPIDETNHLQDSFFGSSKSLHWGLGLHFNWCCMYCPL